jgi:hypothetical protein
MGDTFRNVRASLPDVAEAVRAQLLELHQAPCEHKCASVLRHLEQVSGHVTRLRMELQRAQQ